MVLVQIVCPICKKVGYIDIDKDSLRQNSRGITAINISMEHICPHSFLAYVDRNFHVRDFMIVDFNVESLH